MPTKKRETPNIFVTVLAIGGGAVVGHLAGQTLKPMAQSRFTPRPTPEAAREQISENEGFNLSLTPREIMPGIALALMARSYISTDVRALALLAFLGSASLTALAGTPYDEKTRAVLKKFAPGGQFLA